MKSFLTSYIGNGAYCFSNSMAMLLKAGGEEIPVSLLEVLSGVGLGAFLRTSNNLLFLSNFSGLPDVGISKSLQILGFEFEERYSENPEEMSIENLKNVLKEQTAVLGPLDMGYLIYNPSHKYLYGTDHYVLAIEADDNGVTIHDPAEFPYAYITFEQLKPAWKAENISYHRGHYRYWFNPRRARNPSQDEIYMEAIKWFKQVYEDSKKYSQGQDVLIESEAIKYYINLLSDPKKMEGTTDILTSFTFPVTARRSIDFADFFKDRNEELSNLKLEQAKLIGHAQSLTMAKKYKELSNRLLKFADLEEQFENKLQELN